MAVPIKDKTWQFATNLNPGFNGTDLADIGQLFVLVKNALKAIEDNPWNVQGSSDSVTAGMDAVDRLIDHTDVVRAGGAHSWIVLQQDAIGTGAQILFDFIVADARYINIYFSPADGFTGGNTTTRPTATDELQLSNSNFEFITGFTSGGMGTSMRAHVMVSSDGLCTRIIGCQGNIARSLIMVDVPINPPTGWANPVFCAVAGHTGLPPNDPLSINYWTNTANLLKAVGPVDVMPMNMTMQGFATSGTSNGIFIGHTPWVGADEASGEMPISGVGIAHVTTVGQRGRHGYIADFWTTALSASQGTSFPGDGSKDFVVLGNFVFPWDGGDIEIG
jgi:hypothetical protein